MDQDGLNQTVKGILDTHLIPYLKEEWKPTLSLFEAGISMDDEKPDIPNGIIVWIRSHDIVTHVLGLMSPNPANMTIDLEKRPDSVKGMTGWPRLMDDGTIVRLIKTIPVDESHNAELMVEFFQIDSDAQTAKKTWTRLTGLITGESPSSAM